MEVFDINKYKGKYVMHTVTKEQYDEFCAYLDSVGKRFMNGGSYADTTDYYDCREDTCINFNIGGYSDVEYYKTNGYTILEMEDFIMPTKEFTKADLKTGDFIKLRDGCVGVVNAELGAIAYRASNRGDLCNYSSDLKCIYQSCCDIMAVRRPMSKSDFSFDIFVYETGKLIYERKEVEEMTLEQVCKLLGKEIKIVKG